MSDISEQGIIIFSIHIVDDVKELCTNMAVINKGEVVAKGHPQDLINELSGKVFKKVIEKSELDHYKEKFRVISNRLSAGKTEIHIISSHQQEQGFEPIMPVLEDVYFDKIF